MGSRSLLQRIFSTQGLKLGLLHCRQILNHLSHLYLINSLYSIPGESLDLSSKALSLSLAMFSLIPILLRYFSFFFLFLISMTLLSFLAFLFGAIENSVVGFFLLRNSFFFLSFLDILKFPLRSVYFIWLFSLFCCSYCLTLGWCIYLSALQCLPMSLSS